jgi:hypothetical protein
MGRVLPCPRMFNRRGASDVSSTVLTVRGICPSICQRGSPGGGARHGAGRAVSPGLRRGLAGLYSLRPDWVTPAGVQESLLRLKLRASGDGDRGLADGYHGNLDRPPLVPRQTACHCRPPLRSSRNSGGGTGVMTGRHSGRLDPRGVTMSRYSSRASGSRCSALPRVLRRHHTASAQQRRSVRGTGGSWPSARGAYREEHWESTMTDHPFNMDASPLPRWRRGWKR